MESSHSTGRGSGGEQFGVVPLEVSGHRFLIRKLCGACPRAGAPLAAGGRVAELADRARELSSCGRGGGIHEDTGAGNEFRNPPDFARDDREPGGKEIGRASCRERGEVWGVGGP